MYRMKDPAHPGEILKDLYMEPLNLTVTETAKKLGVNRNVVSKIVNKKGGISPEMAYKLAKAFDSDPEYWITLQTQYDMAKACKTVNLDKVEVIYKAS